jgi:hypothetical protein
VESRDQGPHIIAHGYHGTIGEIREQFICPQQLRRRQPIFDANGA